MLPLEVLDLIFCFLQHVALKLYSMAHPLFAQMARRHLYDHVTVYNLIADSEVLLFPTELSKLLSKNPHISNYIRSLNVGSIHTKYIFYEEQP